MLQQDQPEDYVIATGKQYSARDFVSIAAEEMGFTIKWEDSGVNEKGIIDKINDKEIKGIRAGDIIVAVDPRYFRPTEVETLLGDPTKAREKLGWTPKTSFHDLVKEMVQNDLKSSEKDALVKMAGYSAYDYNE